MNGIKGGRLLGTVVLAASLQGCLSVEALKKSEGRNKVYLATGKHIELGCTHLYCLQVPFSLIGDTLLLPVTVPWSLYNLTAEEPGA